MTTRPLPPATEGSLVLNDPAQATTPAQLASAWDSSTLDGALPLAAWDGTRPTPPDQETRHG